MKLVEAEKAPKVCITTGAALNSKTFADFHQRLLAAQNPANHGTSQPIFCVYTKEYIYGVDPDWHSEAEACVTDGSNETTYTDFNAYYDSLSESDQSLLDEQATSCGFKGLCPEDQFEAIRLAEVGYTTYRSQIINRWVSAHFTPEAAQAFIKRKQHDYPYGLEMVVNSSYYCHEFNAIRYAFLTNNLHYLPDDLACNITPTEIFEPNLEHSIYDATVDDIGSVINSVMAYYKVSFADLALTTNIHRISIHYISKGTRKVNEKQLAELKKALLYAVSTCERKPIEFETCKAILTELRTLQAEKTIAKLNTELEESLSLSVQKPDAYTVKSRKLALYCFIATAFVALLQIIFHVFLK